MLRITTIRRYAGRAGEVVTIARRRPTWLGRVGITLVLVVLGLVGIVLLIPLAAVAVAGLIVGVGVGAVHRLLTGARRPNGLLDGRRNVRVIGPREERGPGA